MVEGDAGRKDAVEEALEDGRKIEPPLRKDKDQPVGSLQPRNDVVDAEMS